MIVDFIINITKNDNEYSYFNEYKRDINWDFVCYIISIITLILFYVKDEYILKLLIKDHFKDELKTLKTLIFYPRGKF